MRLGTLSTSSSTRRASDSFRSPRKNETAAVESMSALVPSLRRALCLFWLLNSSTFAEWGGGEFTDLCSMASLPKHSQWMTLEEKFESSGEIIQRSSTACVYQSLNSTTEGCMYCSETQTLDCTGDTLNTLPNSQHYPEDVLHLRISQSNLTKIPAGALFGREIESVVIDYNLHLKGEIEDGAFENLPSLKVLNITRSGLKETRKSWFRGLYRLESLSFLENDIEFDCEGDSSDEYGEENVYASVDAAPDEEKRLCSWNDLLCRDDPRPLLPQLKTLELGKNKISCLTGNSFLWLKDSKLESLSLQGASLKSVDNGTLLPIAHALRKLDISDSTIRDNKLLYALLWGLNGNETSLEELGASCLGLNRMPKQCLKIISRSLNTLSLYGNYFHSIEKQSFPYMDKLQKLDLRQCDIKIIETGSFENLPNLTILLLANNRIVYIDGIFNGLNFLSHLDFSYNLGVKLVRSYSYDPFTGRKLLLQPIYHNHSFPSSLTSLDLSFTKINKFEEPLFQGLNQLRYLSICYTNFEVSDEKIKIFTDLEHLLVLDMSGNTWLGRNWHRSLFKGLISLQRLYLNAVRVDDSYYNSQLMHDPESPFQPLVSLRLLSLKENLIRTLNESVFTPLKSLEILYLSNNHLNSWEKYLFAENHKLKVLTLHQNQLSYISDTMLEEFRKLSEISLFFNPLICNCKVYELAMLAKSGDIKFLEWYKEDYYLCINRSVNVYEKFDGMWGAGCNETNGDTINEKSLSEKSPVTTSFWNKSVIGVIIICGLCVITLFILMKKYYSKHPGSFFKSIAMIGHTNGKNKFSGKGYNYDLFVSYSDHDRSWVIDQLLPNLELKNESKEPGPAFKVCLHERDFQVGCSILENIINCMDSSGMILLVVSSTFLESQWCQFEMRLAQHRLLETRRDDLLLVFLEEIPREKRPKMLHYLMATKTYLVWNTETSQELFWKRLKNAVRKNAAQSDTSISSFP